MSGTTPRYGWPYLVPGDALTIASLGQAGLLAVEATMAVVDLRTLVQPNRQTFVAGGTWNMPTGTKWVLVEGVGSGAGGGGSAIAAASQNSRGSGGGSGGYSVSLFDAATLTASVAVTIGAAGVGVSNADGTAGADCSFGAFLVAKGGTQGTKSASSGTFFGTAGGNGGVAGTGQIAVPGRNGGMAMGITSLGISGDGGSSQYGAGGKGISAASAPASLAGNPGLGFGAGGSGALSTAGGAANAGGNGTTGIIIVTAFTV